MIDVSRSLFANLYEMVHYFYSISASNDIDQLEAFADWEFAQHKDRYPFLKEFNESTRERLLVNAFFESQESRSGDSWMNFDEEKLNILLHESFFQDYNDTISYKDNDYSLVKDKTRGLLLLNEGRKYPFLEIYTLLKLESIAICNLENRMLIMMWYDWCYKDYIVDYIWTFKWYGIIADVFIKKGRNWFYDTNTFYPNLGLDAAMYRWACYGIEACHLTNRMESKILKREMTDLLSELLIASARSGALERNQAFINEIQEAITNFDEIEIEQLNKKMEFLQHENQKLLNDKVTMENTMGVLRKEIAKLELDSTRTDDEKAEVIAKKIYAMMPDASKDNGTEYEFSKIWERLSDETRRDINRSVRFFQELESVDVALFLMIRNVERECARHFFEPFQESDLFKNMGSSICQHRYFSKTNDALMDTKNHLTMGTIPYIEKAINSETALKSSKAIASFSEFLGTSCEAFCEICRNIGKYRVGLKKNKIVDIRNIFAHGNADTNHAYDKSSYEDVVKFLYEPPLEVMFRIVMNSKRNQ